MLLLQLSLVIVGILGGPKTDMYQQTTHHPVHNNGQSFQSIGA
jgi:hypothetical protein